MLASNSASISVKEKQPVVKVNGVETTNKVNGTATDATEKVTAVEATEKLTGKEVTEEATKQVTGIEATEKVTGQEATEKVTGEEATEKLAELEEAEKINGLEAVEKVTGVDAAEEVVAGMEATEKVTEVEATDKVKKVEAIEKVVEKIVFPPPSSWYRPHVVAKREDMWAYIALNLVVVVKPRENPSSLKTDPKQNGNSEDDIKKPEQDGGLWPHFSMVGIQRDKYASISFCQAKYEDLPLDQATLVTGCEGGYVRIWDVYKNAAIAFHDNHQKSPVAAVVWSPRNFSIIYSLDEEGCLTLWNLKKNSLQSMSFGKVNANCLSVSPSEDNIIAIGTKGGKIFIVETVGTGKILHKMRHEEEVINVNWCPRGNWEARGSFNQRNNKSLLISSIFSVKTATIRVWDRQGKDVAVLPIWEKDQKDSYYYRKATKYFTSTCWATDPNTGNLMLVVGGKQGEILAFTEGSVANEIHRIHSNSFIFGLVQFGDILWSLSFEPIIVGWNLRTNQVESVIPTFRGVASMMSSPVEASRIVIGGIDSCIRIMNMQNGYPEYTSVKSPTVTHRMKGKISAVAWHPTRENKIGFGTDEGVLGVYEWKEDNKHAVMFDRRVSGTIYTVDWGPQCQYADDPEHPSDKNKDNFMLYCCGGQSVYMIHPSKHTNSLINVSKIIEKSNPGAQVGNSEQDKASEIRWSPDRSYLAVGFADGRIELYAPPNLKMRCWIKCHGRAIQFFSWRAFDFLAEQREANVKERWFASASNDGTTRLFNLEELFEEDFKTSASAEPLQLISSAATLQGHGGLRVIWLSWSPHNKDLLVTCSYDRTAIVWNIKDGSHISRYMEHQHRLVVCMFHPTDPYKVISCSDELSLDFTVHIWDYREHPYRASFPKQAKSAAKANPLKAVKEHESFVADYEGEELRPKAVTGTAHIVQLPDKNSVMLHPKAEEKVKSKLKAKSRALMPTTSNALINAKHSLNHEIRYIVDKTKIPTKLKESTNAEVDLERSLPKISQQELDDPISEMVEPATTDSSNVNDFEDPILHLGILGSSDECQRAVNAEIGIHRQKDNWNAAAQLTEWSGNSTAFIREAIVAGQVTEMILSSASVISKKLYFETMEAYITQLVDQEEYYKAVHYMLLSNQLEKALELLMSKKMFRDAAAIAKLRLPDCDPLLVKVNEKWIYQLMCDGNFELAAKIYCSMKRYSEALTAIEKRNLPYAWKAGVYVASKANDTKKVEMLGVRYIQDCLAKGFYDECFEIVQEITALRFMIPIVAVYQCIQEAVSSLKAIGESDEEGLQTWKEVLSEFDEEVKEVWESHGIEVENSELHKKIKSALLLVIPQSSNEALQIIVKDIVLVLMDDEDKSNRLSECYSLAKTWCEPNDPLTFSTVTNCLDCLANKSKTS